MNCYIYATDVYCEECAQAIMKKLHAEFGPYHHGDDNSEEYPCGPYSDDEADCPQHCASGEDCLDPTILPSGARVGKFLDNPLTADGATYVLTTHHKNPSEVTRLWLEAYSGIHDFPDSSDEIIDDDNRWAYES